MKSSIVATTVALLLALLPFASLHYLPYDDINSKYFYLVFLVDLLVLGFAYTLFQKRKVSLKGRYLLGALGLVLIVEYLAVFLGSFPGHSLWSDIFWSSGVFFLTHLAGAAVILSEWVEEGGWSRMFRWVVYSGGIFGLLSFIGWQGLGLTSRFLTVSLDEAGLSLGNETYAGAYLLLAFIAGLIAWVKSKKGGERKLIAASLIGMAVSPLLINTKLFLGQAAFSLNPAILLGTARASSAAFFALVAFIGGLLLIRRFAPKSFREVAMPLWSGIVLCGVVVGVALLFTPGSSVQQAYIAESTAARVILWEASVEAFKDRPVLGWGPENFNYAFEANFDNRLFEDKNIGEIWFERAHNVFLDTLVTLGVVGFVAYALLIGTYLLVVYRAGKRNAISKEESVLLTALIPAHLLQMQTGFDTVGSYALLAFFLGYALFLERKGAAEGKILPRTVQQGVAVMLVVLALISLKFLVLDEYGRQAALTETFRAKEAALQKSYAETSLGRLSSFESFRLSFSSFLTGAFALLAENPSPERSARVVEYLGLYEKHLATYLAAEPEHYRARMNYAYLLLVKSALGENRVEEAKAIITDSYELSPKNPLTYVLDSVAELYRGNLKEADRLMAEALAQNPDVEFTQEAATYLETQKRNFPNISILKLGNL